MKFPAPEILVLAQLEDLIKICQAHAWTQIVQVFDEGLLLKFFNFHNFGNN